MQATYNSFIQVAEAHQVNVSYWMLNAENAADWFIRHSRNIDGVVLADTGHESVSEGVREKLRSIRNCVPLMERQDCNMGAIIRNDDRKAGVLAAEVLIRRGYRRILIAAVSPGLNVNPFYMRVEGFVQTLLEAGLPELSFQVAASEREADFSDVRGFLERFGVGEGLWEAVFCITDCYALRCMEALREMGVKVPEEIGVIGIDGVNAGLASTPALSTVIHDSDAIATAAFEMLAGLRPCANVACEPRLVERTSLDWKKREGASVEETIPDNLNLRRTYSGDCDGLADSGLPDGLPGQVCGK